MLKYLYLVFITLFLLCGLLHAQVPNDIQKFSIDEILKEDPTLKRKEVINNATMRVEVQMIGRNDKSQSEAYPEDATYYVIKGEASVVLGDSALHTSARNVLYVKAGTKLQFTGIKKGLEILAMFSKAASSAQDKAFSNFSLDEIEQSRTPNDNDWEPFLKAKTITLGLYMLPQKIGGDSTLVHKTDELNFIIKGHCKFTVDNTTMDVKKGDIIFVGKGRGHYFHNLTNDFDVLIWWERKSLEGSGKK